MTFTYDASEASDLHKVRGLIGDVTETNPKYRLSDETITAVLSLHPDTVDAAIACIDRLIALHVQNADRSGAGISTQRSVVFQQYKELRVILEKRLSHRCTGTAGGLSDSTNRSYEQDTDFVLPYFGDDLRIRTTGGDSDEG